MFSKRIFILPFFFLLLGLSIQVKSQAVLFNQDFEDTAQLFQGYVLSNFDLGTPADAEWATLGDSSWVVRAIPGFDTHAAVATSHYSPAVIADDWFVTPAIRLGPASKLTFKSISLNPGKPDSFEVYISTSEQSANGCLFNLPLGQYTSTQITAFETREINLAEAGYARQTVYLGFRLNTTSGGDKLAIDDILVTDDSIQSLVSLTFNVNMSKYIADSLFHPSTDTVDVAGSFNNWDGTKSIMHLIPGTDSTIYTITIPGFYDGDKLQFKFRINSSWNDTAVEFPYGAPNRMWNVEHDRYIYTAFYNEAGVISDIPESAGLMKAVSVFPNPVIDQLTIIENSEIQCVRLMSIRGEVLQEYTHSGDRFILNVSWLPSGTYFLAFYSKQGFAGCRKIIKE